MPDTAIRRMAGDATSFSEEESVRILFVCSSGGHLTQLATMRPWWGNHRRRWVTFKLPDTEARLAGENTVWAHFPTTRNVGNLVRNTFLAVKTLAEGRPDVIISTGAGVAIPFFVLGRLMGVPTVYIEVIDRIDSPTVTGRVCQRLASVFCVQSKEQQRIYPGAEVIGALL